MLEELRDSLDAAYARRRNALLISTVPLILIFISILGVNFEIAVLGIKLEGISHLKEAVLVLTALSGMMFALDDDQISLLKSLRLTIRRKELGPKLETYADALYGEFQLEWILGKMGGRFDFSPSPKRRIVEKLYKLSVGASAILFLISASIIYFMVARDAWIHPNLNPAISRLICVATGPLTLFNMYTSLIRNLSNQRYYWKNKSEGSGEQT